MQSINGWKQTREDVMTWQDAKQYVDEIFKNGFDRHFTCIGDEPKMTVVQWVNFMYVMYDARCKYGKII